MFDWIFFTMLAPIFWACSNVIDTGVRRNYVGSDSALTWFFCAVRLVPVIVLLILFGHKFEINSSFWMIFFAGIFWTVPFYFYYKSLKFEEPSRVVLFMQTLPIVTFIIAAVFFGER
ncbi:MAG: EamA family transporter, partial [Patescibacteria group bacterium]